MVKFVDVFKELLKKNQLTLDNLDAFLAGEVLLITIDKMISDGTAPDYLEYSYMRQSVKHVRSMLDEIYEYEYELNGQQKT